MGKTGRWMVFLGCLCALLAALAYFVMAEKAVLKILVETPVWSSAESSGQRHQVGILQAGQTVVVSRCIDTKHFFVYEVTLPSNTVGYVDSGGNDIEVTSALANRADQPVVWNCH